MKNKNKLSKTNIKEYDRKYLKLGYGIKYPEGHVIRHSSLFKNKNTLLDFGCGNGTHLFFFKRLGVKNISGVDTSKIVNKIKIKNGIKVYKINQHHNLLKIFKQKSFDIIFSNQVLYYLDNSEINFYLKQFNKLLKKGGIIFTTWMAPKTHYYKMSKKIKNTTMRRVDFNKRLKEATYINFKNINQISKMFKKNNFRTDHFGHYYHMMNYNISDSGSFHYLHVAQKIY